jgi:hypothetical protein
MPAASSLPETVPPMTIVCSSESINPAILAGTKRSTALVVSKPPGALLVV